MRLMLYRVHRGVAPIRPITRRPYWLWAFLAGQLPGPMPTLRDAGHVQSIVLGPLPYELVIAWGKPMER